MQSEKPKLLQRSAKSRPIKKQPARLTIKVPRGKRAPRHLAAMRLTVYPKSTSFGPRPFSVNFTVFGLEPFSVI
jgi:hypothetical protein